MQLKALLLIFIFLSSTIFAVPDSPSYEIDVGPLGPFDTPEKYERIVEKLQVMIDNNNWNILFETAIEDARGTGAREMQYIKNLTDYYNFLNYFVRWVPTERETGTYVHSMMMTMYFVLSQRSVEPLQSPIAPWSNPPYTELSQWIIDFAKELGKFLSTKESITEASLKTFYTAQGFNVDAYEIPVGGWKSFNDFFTRKFKKGTRPIDGPSNPAVIVSAVDSIFGNCWSISEKSIVVLKGLPWSINQLLSDSKYKDDFANGLFMHEMLMATNYHRIHAPVDGTVLEAKVIPGLAYYKIVATGREDEPGSSVSLRKVESESKITLNVTSVDGFQFSQARGMIIIDSPIGKVAVLPIGMGQVSSVVLTVEVGQKLKKGDEISFFQFGGSDCVLVFQNESQVSALAVSGKQYRVGEQIAIAHNVIPKS